MTEMRRSIFSSLPAYIAGFVLVGALFYHMGNSKFLTLRQLSNFDPADDTGLLWTENAFHYRYAKMAAMGERIPEVDVKMQYPEGMHVLRDEMPMMERFAGAMYRKFGAHLPFHVYLMFLVCFYSSLIVFPAYLLSSYLWKNAVSGIATSLFYVLTYSFIGGVVLGAYVRQDFALPFLFLGTFFIAAGIDTGKKAFAFAAAALMAFSFASWHLSQFYYLVLLAGMGVLYFFMPKSRSHIASTVAIVTIVSVGTSFFFLPLRSGMFPLSLAMLASYALLAQHFLLRKRPEPIWKRIALFLVLLVVLTAGASLVARGHYGRYSHVYQLIVDKLRFLGVKPSDPSKLSFESRVMWTSSFLSPSLRVMAGWLSGAWIAGILGAALVVWQAVKKREASPSQFLVLWMAVVFVALFALIQRMDIFAGFFVCLLVGRVMPRNVFSRKGAQAVILLFVLLFLNYRNMTSLYMVSGAPPASRTKPLYEVIRKNTASNAVILARFPFGPSLCAYTDRSVVLHPKFENERVREKVKEFNSVLFGSEREFYEFCRKYDVSYFIYEPAILLDQSNESMRYRAGKLVIDDTSVVPLMHFLPQALTRFQLVYQSPAYRVYKVLEQPRAPGPVPFEPLPAYDSKRFRREDLRLREARIWVGGQGDGVVE